MAWEEQSLTSELLSFGPNPDYKFLFSKLHTHKGFPHVHILPDLLQRNWFCKDALWDFLSSIWTSSLGRKNQKYATFVIQVPVTSFFPQGNVQFMSNFHEEENMFG